MARIVISRGILVSPEGRKIHGRSMARQRGELTTGNKAAAAPDGDQFGNLPAVPGHGERLPALNGIHDLLGPAAQIPLGDLRLCTHDTIVSHAWHMVLPCATGLQSGNQQAAAGLAGSGPDRLAAAPRALACAVLDAPAGVVS
jgi:hypothetical protein